ncbi:hypothetical protein GPJ59_10770 [Streptomyces bambusae]|uniref:Uncharacterized protein n=1 Tax=Streptomyces bambusae TaxID=1550616 RepID=A0ABS6Z3L9_9ACTN|nr:hypothetical protein [Streptomyces bambusae]
MRASVLRDLRRSARSRAAAQAAGRRPQPETVTRRVEIRTLARYLRDPFVARWAAYDEGRARRRLRDATTALVRLARTDPRALADADIPPARHRRAGLWLA